MSEKPEVHSVEDLDLQRYLGLWFEIGRLPMRFEDDDAIDVTADYSLKDNGTVRVDNRCLDADRRPVQALGQAEPDPEHAGRLRVSFLPSGLRWIPFTRADYWVLRIDERYRYALVGTPDRKYLWLLAREHRIDPAIEEEYLGEAERQGYEIDAWIRTPHSGARVMDEDV